MREKDDWRHQGQEKYIKGVSLFWKTYKPANPNNDHDHCEFCTSKFMVDKEDTLKEGYSTEDGYYWICKVCFNDFVDLFDWQVS